MSYEDKRVFFHAGDLVQLKQSLPNKPVMLVMSIPKVRMTEEAVKPMLLGVTCAWFTKDGLFQKQTFNTKDLEKVILKD
jgi:uncharacterized protein YodC (DUF2158 family)